MINNYQALRYDAVIYYRQQTLIVKSIWQNGVVVWDKNVVDSLSEDEIKKLPHMPIETLSGPIPLREIESPREQLQLFNG